MSLGAGMNRKNRKGTIPLKVKKCLECHKEMKESDRSCWKLPNFLNKYLWSLYKGFTIYIKIIWFSWHQYINESISLNIYIRYIEKSLKDMTKLGTTGSKKRISGRKNLLLDFEYAY